MAETNDKAQFKAIQFRDHKYDKIVELRDEIAEQRGTAPSLADTVMEGIKLLERKVNK